MRVREAKDFLVGQIAPQSQAEGKPLSDPARRGPLTRKGRPLHSRFLLNSPTNSFPSWRWQSDLLDKYLPPSSPTLHHTLQALFLLCVFFAFSPRLFAQCAEYRGALFVAIRKRFDSE